MIYLGKGEKCESGYIYKCMNNKCGARVNTFPKDKDIAVGTLADKETGKLRIEVHKLLDNFWKNNKERKECYKRLAEELGIDENECHIGYFQKDMLLKAQQILLRWWIEKYDK